MEKDTRYAIKTKKGYYRFGYGYGNRCYTANIAEAKLYLTEQDAKKYAEHNDIYTFTVEPIRV